MKTMYCPFMNAQIDNELCLKISMEANGEENGLARDDTFMEAMRDRERKKTCMHCQWHRVYCPVMGERVDGRDCFEICEVADHYINESILEDFPHPPVWNEAQREKCLHCKWHADVGE